MTKRALDKIKIDTPFPSSNSHICDTIDWYSFGSAMRCLTPGLHRQATKFLYDWLPLNTN